MLLTTPTWAAHGEDSSSDHVQQRPLSARHPRSSLADFSDPATYSLSSFNTRAKLDDFLTACEMDIQTASEGDARLEKIRQAFDKIEVVAALLKGAVLHKIACEENGLPIPDSFSIPPSLSGLPEWEEDAEDHPSTGNSLQLDSTIWAPQAPQDPSMGWAAAPLPTDWEKKIAQLKLEEKGETDHASVIRSEDEEEDSFLTSEEDTPSNKGSQWAKEQMSHWVVWLLTGKDAIDATSPQKGGSSFSLLSQPSRGSYESDGVPSLTAEQSQEAYKAVMADIERTLTELVTELGSTLV